jgi:hypothetical protein
MIKILMNLKLVPNCLNNFSRVNCLILDKVSSLLNLGNSWQILSLPFLNFCSEICKESD